MPIQKIKDRQPVTLTFVYEYDNDDKRIMHAVFENTKLARNYFRANAGERLCLSEEELRYNTIPGNPKMWYVYLCGASDCFLHAAFFDEEEAYNWASQNSRNPEGFLIKEGDPGKVYTGEPGWWNAFKEWENN